MFDFVIKIYTGGLAIKFSAWVSENIIVQSRISVRVECDNGWR